MDDDAPSAQAPSPAPEMPPDGQIAAEGQALMVLATPAPSSGNTGGTLSTELAYLAERAGAYASKARGDGTRAAYGSAWKTYSAWCHGHGREPLAGDPAQLALYLTQRAEDGLAVSSIKVARAAIRDAHRLAGVPLDLDDPRLGLVMEGIARSKGARPRRQAAPVMPELLRRLLAALPDPATPAAAAPALAARHRAMLLLGFGAALRRSEIVALTIGDIALVDGRGLTVLIRRAKGDQQGKGRTLAIWANHADPTFCTVAAMEGWLAYRQAATDCTPPSPALPADAWRAGRPLFCGVASSGALSGQPMSDKIVTRILKHSAAAAGLDAGRFSGHSLRRGLLTTAGDLQLPLIDLMRQSRHKSVDTALGYIEAADIWRNNITEPVFGGRKRP